MNFKNLKTSLKLGLSFSLVTLFTAAVCFVGWLGINRIYDGSDVLSKLGTVRAQYNIARLYTRTYMHLKDAKYVDEANKSLDIATSLLKEIEDQTQDKEHLDVIKSISTGLIEYRSILGQNKSNMDTYLGIVETAKSMGEEMKTALTAVKANENHPANHYFVLSRMNLIGYLAYTDRKYIDQAKENINIAINRADDLKSANIEDILKRYQTNIVKFEEAANKAGELENKQLETGKLLTANFNQLYEQTNASCKEQKSTSTTFMAIFTLIALLFSIFIALIVTRYLNGMIGKSVLLARTYASGDLTVKVPEEDLKIKDELGDLARAMVEMGQKTKEIIAGIMQGADNVAIASVEISSTTQQLSQGASEQASAAEEVSSSMEEMLSSIQQNSDNALQTDKIANTAAEGMKNLSRSSEKSLASVKEITNKISIINDIAFQTNILALNAAVEAARAGEHGKGFAVVAAEVRKLAERSKVAANEIIDLSKTSLEVTEDTVRQMANIIPEIEKTAKLVQEIAASSKEQNSGAEQVNDAIQQLNEVTQQNAAASEEMATSAEELAAQAEQLKELISFFNVENSADWQRKKKENKTVQPKKGTTVGHIQHKEKGVHFNISHNDNKQKMNDSEFERF